MLRKNEVYTANISDINNLGYGIAKIDGMVVFVSGGVTGDVLDIKIIKVGKDFCIGKIEKIISSSEYRTESGCPVSNRCGGCVYRNITREYELELKRSYVKHAFLKAGLIADVLPTDTNGISEGCRNKAQYPVSENGDIGFYARHSHDIVKCESCMLVPEEFDAILKDMSALIKKHGIKGIRHICLRKGFGTGEIMLCIVAYNEIGCSNIIVDEITGKHEYVKSIVLNINPDNTNVILGKKCINLYGSGEIRDILCGLEFRISALSFYQVNHDMAERLYGEAISRAAEANPKTVADLYCGTGTIGLILASALKDIKLTGIEIVNEAVLNARENALTNKITGAEFICGDALIADVSRYDCVVIDPPRKGMSKELVEKLISEHPQRLVYISCNPDTLARDAKMLSDGGYVMGAVKPFDMFPRTGAIECVTDFTYRKAP